MRLKLPLRVASAVRAGVVRKRTVRRTVRHGGKPHKVRRTVTVLEPRARVRFGGHVRLAGRLVDRAGNPLGGAWVQVYSRPREGDEGQVGTLSTNAQGRFAYVVEASATKTLRFVYLGAATRLPAEDKVALIVAGRSTFAVSRSHAEPANGGRAAGFRASRCPPKESWSSCRCASPVNGGRRSALFAASPMAVGASATSSGGPVGCSATTYASACPARRGTVFRRARAGSWRSE